MSRDHLLSAFLLTLAAGFVAPEASAQGSGTFVYGGGEKAMTTKQKVLHGAKTAASIAAVNGSGKAATEAVALAHRSAMTQYIVTAGASKAISWGGAVETGIAGAEIIEEGTDWTDPFGGKRVYDDKQEGSDWGTFASNSCNGFLNRLCGWGDFVTGGSAGKLGDNLQDAIR